MSIISKETWDKFTQEEKEKIKQDYQKMLDGKTELTEEEKNGAIFQMEWLIGKENLHPQPLTYRDVARELFEDGFYFIDSNGKATYINRLSPNAIIEPNNCTSQKQAEKLLAINKLLNVAKYLNGDWKPDWENEKQQKFSFVINQNGAIQADEYYFNCTFVYFSCPDYVYKAIQILGKDTVRMALTTEY